MPQPSRQSPAFRLVVVALTLCALTSAGLLVEAIRAGRRHRAAAARVVSDYARSAGWLLAAAYRADLATELLAALGPPVVPPSSAGRAQPTSLAELQRWAAGAAPCRERLGDGGRFYFTLRISDRRLHTAGAEPSADVRTLLRDSLVTMIGAGAGRVERVGIRSYGGSPPARRLVVFGIQRDSAGAPMTLLGLSTCQSWLTGSIGDVVERHPLLPPFLVGALPAESLLSVVAVRAWSGDTVYRSPVRYPGTYSSRTPSVGVLGLDFDVAVNPALAPRLVIGGLPRSHLPWLLCLLAVSATAFAILLLQLRQGARLARAQTDFVTSVSHEIRTPLSQVLLFGESLKYGTARTPADRALATDVIVEEARRLIHLAENVLHVSRPGSRPEATLSTALPLAPLVRHTVSAYEPLARHRHASFALDLAEEVAAPVDQAHLRQVLINLLDNAVKFGPEHQRITVSVAAAGERALIAVADRGPGVPAAGRNRIWEPFTRLHVEARRPGSGIGLAVVRKLTRQMGGEVWVEDRDGGGSRFVVGLPLSREGRR